MRPVTSRLEVELRTIPISNVSPTTAVGIPPSDADAVWDQMRVAVGGRVILRDFDPGDDIETGAPIPYVTTSGEAYVTKTAEPYVTKVSA